MNAVLDASLAPQQAIGVIRPEIKCTIYGTAQVADVRHRFEDFCWSVGVGDEMERQLLGLAFGEAAANAIVHGGRCIVVAYAISVPGSLTRKRLILAIANPHMEGESFPNKLQMPEEGANHGRGLPIICEIMDKIMVTEEEGIYTVLMIKEVSA